MAGVIAAVAALAFLSLLEWRRLNLAYSSRERYAAMEIVIADRYVEALVIQSYNPADNTLIASIWSATAGQFIPTKFLLDEKIQIFRRDAIIENGTIVGFSELKPSTKDEFVPEARGVATVSIGTDGRLTINRIMIGVPFPRP